MFAAPYPSATSWLETSHTLLDTNSIREDCDEDFDQDLEEDLDQDLSEDRDKDLNQDEFDNDNDDDDYYGNEDKDGYINHSYHNRLKSFFLPYFATTT